MADNEDEINEKEKDASNEMGFFGHLDELRKRIMWAFVWITVGCVISGLFIEPLMNVILLGPASTVKLQLQNLRPFGIPVLYFKVIFICGFIIAFPFVLYQLWKFIEPGLYKHEKQWAGKITFFTTLCFIAGVSFAYFIMVPSMLGFAATFGTDKIANIIDVNEYFGFITMIMLAAGLIFEMPMIAFILAKFGIIKAKMLRKYWRHAIVVIFIIAAVVTPTPDPINQFFFAVPLFVLYEISIWVAKIAEKKES
jgi:sec-independent protein translocase protein TatC